MRTIAISIEESLVLAIDRLVARGRSSGGRRRGPSRSELIRAAVRQYVRRREREEREARERKILATHRKRLARQAEALISEQAGP